MGRTAARDRIIVALKKRACSIIILLIKNACAVVCAAAANTHRESTAFTLFVDASVLRRWSGTGHDIIGLSQASCSYISALLAASRLSNAKTLGRGGQQPMSLAIAFYTLDNKSQLEYFNDRNLINLLTVYLIFLLFFF